MPEMKIPYLTLTAGQQGGLGYPPVIVKLDKWYAVEDSRDRKPPAKVEPLLAYQRMWKSNYDHSPDRDWHDQGWVWKKWHWAPRLTWDQVLEKVEKNA